jgi:hypothetical protein
LSDDDLAFGQQPLHSLFRMEISPFAGHLESGYRITRPPVWSSTSELDIGGQVEPWGQPLVLKVVRSDQSAGVWIAIPLDEGHVPGFLTILMLTQPASANRFGLLIYHSQGFLPGHPREEISRPSGRADERLQRQAGAERQVG